MTPNVFISYRRADAPSAAGRIFDFLEQQYTKEAIFIDVDQMPGGVDFVREVYERIEITEVMLVVIGKHWLKVLDAKTGRPRIENAGDFVRIEIEHALKNDIEIIPLLVEGAEMQKAEELPRSLKPLSRFNALRLTNERFRADIIGLKKNVESAAQRMTQRRNAEEQLRKAEIVRNQEIEERLKLEQIELKRQQARLDAISGLSKEDIAAAEAVANWNFVKDTPGDEAIRDHIARYHFHEPSTKWALSKLDELKWAEIGLQASQRDLQSYLEAFPNGRYVKQAKQLIGASNNADLNVDEKVVQVALNYSIEPVVMRYASEYSIPLAEARAHASEAKKYLALCAMNPGKPYGMRGPIDQFWHTFITFTALYTDFCNVIAGRYLHHTPFSEPIEKEFYTASGPDSILLNENIIGAKASLEKAYNEMLNDYQRVFGTAPHEKYWPRFFAESHSIAQAISKEGKKLEWRWNGRYGGGDGCSCNFDWVEVDA